MADPTTSSTDFPLTSLGAVHVPTVQSGGGDALARQSGGAPSDGPSSAERRRQDTDSRVAEINSLLNALEEAAADTRKPSRVQPRQPAPMKPPVDNHENRLVQVRLGVASGLYTALQHKHPATASHSLRVALGCSTWALYKRLDDETRDVIEAASLLHDIGKISVPDRLLTNQAGLSPEDRAALEMHWEAGVHILACCCSSMRVLDAVRYGGRRFDGTGNVSPVGGDDLPLESRMIAIVDAFDQMTADPTYGPIKTRAGALEELDRGAGTQFDPILVKQFVELLAHDQELLTRQVAGRWLSELGTRQSELPWAVQEPAPAPRPAVGGDARSLFEQQLIDSMQDGVIFVDQYKNIFMWSKGAERLTGVSTAAATGRQFTPGLLDMCNTAGRRVRDEACPVSRALGSSAQLKQRLEILGRQGEHVTIDLHAIPVFCGDGQLHGATVLLQDAQSEVSLEERVEALHDEATKDPMTKVANRAEFDRMLALFIEAHQQAALPCCLIMTDIDHFKRINDTFGHQAGDEAIITVANLLKSMCRSGDFVARYGGEEFAVLCADCTMDEAAARADQIRKKLSETPHSYLNNRRLTASFGVAQLEPNDTAETMLRRSDQALLTAKEQGRNQVVQLGNAAQPAQRPKKKWWDFGLFRGEPLLEALLVMEVPLNVAIEKLGGFVNDHKARIISTRDSRVEFEISSENIGQYRRQGDRPTLLRVELELSEHRIDKTNALGLAVGAYVHTEAEVAIRPKRRRDRRRSEQLDRARLVMQSLKSYLMAKDAATLEQEKEEAVFMY